MKASIITFYYTEKVATITYVMVGPSGSGTVSHGSETLKVLTGEAVGSTAQAAENYKFVGWYSDVSCTNRITTEAEYVPTKPDSGWKDATYYAVFELAVADLTIYKTGASSLDENQSFIFDVTCPDGSVLTVTINGNSSVTIKDLPIGQYTVTEKTSWSWRYTPSSNSQTITLEASGNSLTFNNSRSINYWLSGDSFKENQFNAN